MIRTTTIYKSLVVDIYEKSDIEKHTVEHKVYKPMKKIKIWNLIKKIFRLPETKKERERRMLRDLGKGGKIRING